MIQLNAQEVEALGGFLLRVAFFCDEIAYAQLRDVTPAGAVECSDVALRAGLIASDLASRLVNARATEGVARAG